MIKGQSYIGEKDPKP